MPTVYSQSIVVDCLNGSALTPGVIRRLRAGGVTALNLTAVQIGIDWDGAQRNLLDTVNAIEQHSDDLLLVRTPADIDHAKSTNRTGIILGMQDAEPIERQLGRLQELARLGVRIIQLTHNRQNYVGTGCCEPDSGVTKFGRRVIEEMNRLGIMIDVAHCGPQTTMDAIEISAVPVICSHANPLAVSTRCATSPMRSSAGWPSAAACWASRSGRRLCTAAMTDSPP